MSDLKEYRKKRDFGTTPEPEGGSPSDKPIYVIQKHDARRLHYDFRIEHEGVLKSWAVPKGLSEDPKDKRLAVQTEDHPLDYANFAGAIPKGEYGGGSVEIWDHGRFVNITIKKGKVKPLGQAIEDGHFLIWIKGERLEGGYAFTRTDEKNWMVVRMRGDEKTKEYPGQVEIGGRTLTLSNQTKNLYAGMTKGDLVAYYRRIAPLMLPHVRNRPLSMYRFPESIDKGFYQKDASDFPDWIGRAPIRHKEKVVEYALLNDEAAIVYLANLAAEPHIMPSTAERPDMPDKVVFDLDPTKKDIALLRDVARSLRDFLQAIGFTAYIMTTGGKGFHLNAPIVQDSTAAEVREFLGKIAETFAAANPEILTTELRKDKRKGRILIDVNRNSPMQTAVAPYGARARPGLPVAMPFAWDDLDSIEPQSFDIFTQIERDAWADFRKGEVSVKEIRERLKG